MKKIALLLLAITIIAVFTSCDRVQTGSPEADNALKAFNAIVKENPERKGYHDEMKHWGLALPGGDKFEWSKDTAANDLDFAMVVSAEPFVKAGLDVKQLEGSSYIYKEPSEENGKAVAALLVHPFNVSDKKETAQGSEDALRRIFKQNPALVTYHEELAHYRLNLSGGFEVQWTETLGLSNADMTFILEADPLMAAGLDVERLEGSDWVFMPSGTDENMGDYPNQLVKIYTLNSGK